jgi:protein KRI1
MKGNANNYGLSPVEILLATDAELNEVLGLKHYAPYRHGSGVGAAGRGMGKRLGDLKSKLSQRRWGEEVEVDKKGFGKDPATRRPQDNGYKGRENNGFAKDSDAVPSGPPKKRVGKKERQRMKAAGADSAKDSTSEPTEKKRKHSEEGGDSIKRQKT